VFCVHRLYRTLSYWLDEPRLHDPSLYVLALPAEYQAQLLVTVFQSQSVSVVDTASYSNEYVQRHNNICLAALRPGQSRSAGTV